MEKEFIPYKQALALKELGFDEECFGWYNWTGKDLSLTNNSYVDINPTPAPTFSQAFRWFREKHGINSTIDNDLYEDDNHIVYSYSLSRISTADDLIELDEDDFVDTYEEAELECLKKLIEIVKQK